MKKLHIECIRVIAVLCVILNHSDLYYTFYSNTDNVITFFCSLFISSICKINVPLFMMITGALLIPKAEEWKYTKKRVARIFLVLLIFSGIIYLLECFLWKQEVFSVLNFIDLFLRRDIQVSYWYLYEYIGILLMVPFLGFMIRNMDDNTLRLCMKMAFIIKLGESILSFSNYTIPFTSFLISDSVFYVLLGYFLEDRVHKDEYRKISYLKMLVISIGCVAFTMLMVVWSHSVHKNWDESILSIFTPILSANIYILFKKIYLQSKKNRFSKEICYLGSCTFGVYLIERIGQRTFLNLYLWLCNKTFGVVACFTYVGCLTLFCFILVGGLRRFKIVRKYI